MKTTPDSQSVDEIVAAIDRYLQAHPGAADTAAGVHDWWLRDTGATLVQVSDALERLVRLGSVERMQSPTGAVFRALPSKR